MRNSNLSSVIVKYNTRNYQSHDLGILLIRISQKKKKNFKCLGILNFFTKEDMFIIRVQFLNYEYFSAFYNCLLSSLQDSCDIFGFSDEQTQARSESFVQREELFPICRTLAFFQFPKNAKKLHWFCRLSTNKNRVGTST